MNSQHSYANRPLKARVCGSQNQANNQITHEAFVVVRHPASDPVNGPVGLTVTIDGMSQTSPELDRGKRE